MLYSILKVIITGFIKVIAKTEVKNLEKLPQEGPVVLACNHTSYWDPVVLGVLLPRRLHFMAKEELFKIFLFGSLIKILGAFPVKRGKSDITAIKNSLKILKEGKVLCIFPEGTRSLKGELLDFESGITLLAYKGNAPIVPVGLKGARKLFPRGFRTKLELNIGDPIYIENPDKGKITNEQLEQITKQVHNKVKELLA